MSLIVRPAVAGTVGAFFEDRNGLIKRGYGLLGSKVDSISKIKDLSVIFLDDAVNYHYKSSPELGEVLKSMKPHDVNQMIISSKIPGNRLDKNDFAGSTEKCFYDILESYGIQKLPILYLHGPDCFHKPVLEKLKELKEEGLVQHLGLCNVSLEQLEAIVNAKYPISCIQIEFNPYYWDEKLVDFCHEKGIVVVGYRPFGDKESKNMFNDERILNIANRVNSTAPAVILQWANQHGITVIPHSNDAKHTEANLLVPEWSLSKAEMKAMDGIKEGKKATTNWQKFLVLDLFADANQWIDSLKKKV